MNSADSDATSSDESSTRTPLDALEERLPSGADVHVDSEADWVMVDPDPSAEETAASTIILESDGDVFTDGFVVEVYSGRPLVSSTKPERRVTAPTPARAFEKAGQFAASRQDA